MQREAGKVMTWKNLIPRGNETTESTVHEPAEERLQKPSKTEERSLSINTLGKGSDTVFSPTPIEKTSKTPEETGQVDSSQNVNRWKRQFFNYLMRHIT